MERLAGFGWSFLILLFVACKTDGKPQAPQAEPQIEFPFKGDYDISTLEVSDEFYSPAESRGEVTEVNEASGLANSLSNPGYLWIHEDSGADAEVILLSKKKAQVVCRYKIKGAKNVDWEDMAVIPGLQGGSGFLYLADIGDNNAKRDDLKIYRIPEPKYNSADSGTTVEVGSYEELSIQYPDGPRDAEALMVDPVTREIYIVTKREDSVQLFELTYPQNWGGTDTMLLRGTFPFTGITAGDISQDGQRVLLKSYSAIFYWKMDREESIGHLLSKTPMRAPYEPVELQGEAICWDGKSYFTLSEKLAGFVPKLYFYRAR